MVFGWGKKGAATNLAEMSVRQLLTGLDRVPDEIFADPYVAAFVQMVVVRASLIEYSGTPPRPHELAHIFAKTIDRFAPGYGQTVAEGIAASARADHEYHSSYMAGHSHGSQYVKATTDKDAELAVASLREFLCRNYGVNSH